MATDDLVSLTTGFLRDLATGRIDEALSVVDENILYENVGLPTVRGMKRFTRAMHMLNGKFLHFDAEILNAAADGGVVLNERIDLLSIGPLRIRFWVCGRFEVVDGRIVREGRRPFFLRHGRAGSVALGEITSERGFVDRHVSLPISFRRLTLKPAVEGCRFRLATTRDLGLPGSKVFVDRDSARLNVGADRRRRAGLAGLQLLRLGQRPPLHALHRLGSLPLSGSAHGRRDLRLIEQAQHRLRCASVPQDIDHGGGDAACLLPLGERRLDGGRVELLLLQHLGDLAQRLSLGRRRRDVLLQQSAARRPGLGQVGQRDCHWGSSATARAADDGGGGADGLSRSANHRRSNGGQHARAQRLGTFLARFGLQRTLCRTLRTGYGRRAETLSGTCS